MSHAGGIRKPRPHTGFFKSEIKFELAALSARVRTGPDAGIELSCAFECALAHRVICTPNPVHRARAGFEMARMMPVRRRQDFLLSDEPARGAAGGRPTRFDAGAKNVEIGMLGNQPLVAHQKVFRQLNIVVDEYAYIAVGMQKPAVQRRRLSTSLLSQMTQRQLCCKGLNDLWRPVGAAIVDDDELPGRCPRLRRKTCQRDGQPPLTVVRCQQYRDHAHRSTGCMRAAWFW